MTTLISYANEYDLYKGDKDIASISEEDQDKLIRYILEPDRDFRELVVEYGIKKSQAEGLWSLVVFAGCALKDAKRITNFDNRTEKDIQEIIAFFSGTNLWLRLEEAYPPFDSIMQKTVYTWSELEKINFEKLTEAIGEPLYKVKNKIYEYLSRSPSQLQSEFIDRMPYHVFKQTYDEGKLALFVDKGLSIAVAKSGIISSSIPTMLSMAFFIGILAFIPVWIFAGLSYGLITLALAIVCKKLTTQYLIKETRKLAITDKEIYRWLIARKIVWLKYIWNS